jgi:hypothetical protein
MLTQRVLCKFVISECSSHRYIACTDGSVPRFSDGPSRAAKGRTLRPTCRAASESAGPRFSGPQAELASGLPRLASHVFYGWPLPAQSFSGPSPLGLATIFYSLRFEISLFVASYPLQPREREREEVGGSERHYIWGGGKKLYLRFLRFPGSARLSFWYR